MKKLVITLSLVLALAIAAAVSLPALAANIGDTTLSVTITGVLEVTAPSGTVGMTEDTPGVASTDPINDITVGANQAGWNLLVEDQRTLPVAVGYMDDGSVELENPTQVKGGEQVTFAPLTNPVPLIANGAAGLTTVTPGVEFQQVLSYLDAPGTYTIVVTFVASY